MCVCAGRAGSGGSLSVWEWGVKVVVNMLKHFISIP